MKKRNIVLTVIIFILLKILYFVSIKHWMEVEPNKEFFIYAPLFFSIVMIYFSMNLWRHTTNGFLNTLTNNKVSFYHHICITLVLIMSGDKHHKDYHMLPIFESNKLLFIGIGAIDAIAIALFFNMLFRSFTLTLYRARDNQ
ncbi:hypothetical protein CVD28_02240 [Bacillus sp. M6-12]|uniref:hypothetical protein n=1 Tax=Bacillus sp. M6-12 TaxID=2054166 RepID=UPI000C75D8AF|nr:hypothetical protein [Bacillus sp. M6-12]PLS19252.1 hypothetical protein CVD28_02240 [Bacillus sp. M6-12]